MLQKEKQEVVKILKGHNDEVQSLVWSPVSVSELPGGVFKKDILTAAILLVTFFCRCTYRIITGYFNFLCCNVYCLSLWLFFLVFGGSGAQCFYSNLLYKE